VTISPTTPTPLVVARALGKTYRRGREQIRALDGASFVIPRGEFVAIVGPSGSGKTTLLNLLGGMDSPSSGSLGIDGHDVQGFTEAERTRFRQHQIGFVFQHFGLLPTLSVIENVALPLLFSKRKPAIPLPDLLQKVGLQHRRDHRPMELSGGEMQRVAIARALVNGPSLLLADEPTGNLDTTTGESIIDLFRELHRQGLTLIVVTHNPRLAEAASRTLELRDGQLGETGRPAAT